MASCASTAHSQKREPPRDAPSCGATSPPIPTIPRHGHGLSCACRATGVSLSTKQPTRQCFTPHSTNLLEQDAGFRVMGWAPFPFAFPMLFLFSDVGDDDAPTRIRVGSHMDMARFLAPAGEAGMSRMNLSEMGADRPTALATGEAGTVYLCHPFLVHAAQPHKGHTPRFMAQPSLGLREQYRLHREDGAYSPVEASIRQALGH